MEILRGVQQRLVSLTRVTLNLQTDVLGSYAQWCYDVTHVMTLRGRLFLQPPDYLTEYLIILSLPQLSSKSQLTVVIIKQTGSAVRTLTWVWRRVSSSCSPAPLRRRRPSGSLGSRCGRGFPDWRSSDPYRNPSPADWSHSTRCATTCRETQRESDHLSIPPQQRASQILLSLILLSLKLSVTGVSIVQKWLN